MTKQEMIKQIAGRLGIPQRDVASTIVIMGELVAEELRTTGKSEVPGVCRMEKTTRAARSGRNPRTGEPVHIPESSGIKFKAASAFKANAGI